ncbi:hypothetical protein LCGC14_1216660 [marine sediment metagenome]|uniref:Uncharacterized protein n=1 Tax=marine sediment metagenome TaxID=412755 RepID=A0A0F9NUS1_9ZZZZ
MTAFAGISQELRGNFPSISRKLLTPRVGASRPVPNPDPFFPTSPPPLSVRHSVWLMDMLSSSVSNSQFFASIFNLAQKLAR